MIETDFESEFIEKYSKEEFDEVFAIMDDCLCDEKDFAQGEIWTLSADIEKIHSLQYVYYFTLSKTSENGTDETVTVTYENGINNGTQMEDYCLEGSGVATPTTTRSVLTDIEMDRHAVERWANNKNITNVNWELAEALLNNAKTEIMKLLNEQSYDYYVTGGGTSKISSHYREKLSKFHNRGLFWQCIYEEIEVDRNFIK